MKAAAKRVLLAAAIVLAALLAPVCALMFLLPKYWIWQQEQDGRAELAKATFSRQIAVQEANAKLEAARSLAQAEIERAKGVAEANRIIGDSLKDNEAYLRYLWIHNLEAGQHDVIYVPTEAGLPILEAARLNQGKSP